MKILPLSPLLALFALGCGGSGSSFDHTGDPNVHDVAMSNMVFSPEIVHVTAGQQVKWTNREDTRHTVTGDVDSQGISSDATFPNGMSNGDTYTFTVPSGTASGTLFFYHCRFHGTAGDGSSLGQGMVGEIVVD